ncbi:MAG: DegV family protein [Dehalococcoidia bacterium]
MKQVAVSADSVSLPHETAQGYGFSLIPCPIILDDKTCLDTEIDIEELYNRIDTRENLPKTSMASVEDFLSFFTETSRGTDDVVHVCMSSAFSPQYKNALQAKELADKSLGGVIVKVVDSLSIGIGVHLIAIAAAKAAAQGKTLDEVLELVSAVTPQLVSLAARDTLFYYDKGGRIFEASSWAEAEATSSFRSIIEVDASTGGTVKPVVRAKTVAQILDKLVELTKERDSGSKLWGFIGYTRGAADRAEKLKEMLLSELDFDWLYVAEESASVAVHNGRGFIDYAFCNKI